MIWPLISPFELRNKKFCFSETRAKILDSQLEVISKFPISPVLGEQLVLPIKKVLLELTEWKSGFVTTRQYINSLIREINRTIVCSKEESLSDQGFWAVEKIENAPPTGSIMISSQEGVLEFVRKNLNSKNWSERMDAVSLIKRLDIADIPDFLDIVIEQWNYVAYLSIIDLIWLVSETRQWKMYSRIRFRIWSNFALASSAMRLKMAELIDRLPKLQHMILLSEYPYI